MSSSTSSLNLSLSPPGSSAETYRRRNDGQIPRTSSAGVEYPGSGISSGISARMTSETHLFMSNVETSNYYFFDAETCLNNRKLTNCC